jgi:hypothetical protein
MQQRIAAQDRTATAVREDGMRSLYWMNITNASLFPDLGGVARSIALELEIVWPAVGKVAG